MRVVVTAAGPLAFSRTHWQKLKAIALETLAAAHRRAPNTIGLSEDRILGESTIRLPREVALATAAELLGEGAIVKETAGVRLPSHMPRLEGAEAALWNKVARLLGQSPLRPPVMHEIAVAIAEDPKKTESFLVRASHLGLVSRVSGNRFFLPEALRQLRNVTEEMAAESKDGRVTAAAFRDRTRIGRTVAIEVLEFFDRSKFTRRVGDAHEVVRPADEVSGRP
jgi:selenocysteine-specific elongation factor